MSRARAAILLLAVFALGAASGAMGTVNFIRLRSATGVTPADRIERVALRRLARRLDLDAEQRRVLMRVTARTRNQMERIREESLTRVDAILDQAYEELLPNLRPDQVEKLDRIRSHARRRWRGHGRPDGPGVPPGEARGPGGQ